MKDKKKLGRGLDALLSTSSTETMASLLGKPKDRSTPAIKNRDGELIHIAIDLVQRGKYQPRTDIDLFIFSNYFPIKVDAISETKVTRSIGLYKIRLAPIRPAS